MKIKNILIIIPILLLSSCRLTAIEESKSIASSIALESIQASKSIVESSEVIEDTRMDYGVFLGANDSKEVVDKLLSYKEVAIEIEAFSEASIKTLKDNNTFIAAYLSVGSLEKYKPYYSEFEQYTFMDYDNWPDERWIDVSQKPFQDKLISLATEYKKLGADGLFLDNYDVYYVACELYKKKNIKEDIYKGLVDITNRLYDLDLKLIFNSGIDFLERLENENKSTLSKVYALNQESVFSTIIDYDNDVFGKQPDDDHDYYVEALKNMHDHGLQIYLLEYTKDENLKKDIIDFCNKNNYKYYISSMVGLY